MNGREAQPEILALAKALSDKPLILVGMMGVGKSSIGRLLAAALERKFIDADVEIERAANCTIEEIFSRYGEAAFRDGERRVIARLMKAKRTVLATGGGAVIDEETRETLHRNGLSIWLDVELDVILNRILRRNDRPLLKVDDKRATLERLIQERRPYYSEAHLHIRIGNEDIDATFEKVIAGLQSHVARAEKARRGNG